MAILDKIRGVGEAVRDKVKETFRSDDDAALEGLDDGSESDGHPGEPALDAAGAYAVLGLKDTATLADVREAYRTKARVQHARVSAERSAAGVESEAQRTLDRMLEALELLEEVLVPLSPSPHTGGAGGANVTQSAAAPPPRRKRATARAR